MLIQWQENGHNYDEFWRRTQLEIHLIFKGDKGRLEREHNDRAWLAYHIAALTRTRKRVTLKSLQVRQRQQQQTWQQQLEIAKQWTVMLGGTVVSARKDH